MYKDAPHEGFTWFRYFRSPMVGDGDGAHRLSGGPSRSEPSGAGRCCSSGWPTCSSGARSSSGRRSCGTRTRASTSSRCSSPCSAASIQGKAQRLLIGFPLAILIVLVFLGVHWMSRRITPASGVSLVTVFLVASISGWISAFLGAWKDAPIEGFETLKFFRSPVAAGLYGLLLAPFTTSYPARHLRGARFHDRHARNLQDVLLSVEAARQICRQADPPSRDAAEAQEVRRAVRGDLAVPDCPISCWRTRSRTGPVCYG